MLDFDTALELMKKYGYSSTVHPYIYQKGETIGLCYSYNDEDFGTLERIQLFEDAEVFESFLKKLDWVKTNGKNYHVRMALDNYESMNPKVIFLRNEKIMVEGEMFDIANYDYRESQREQMDDVSKVIYEAGDLLLVYDEIKGRQLQYLKSIVKLKNSLRQKYFDLQQEVDKYNKYKVERALVLLPEVADIGINEMLEINIKDRYNMYVSQRPTYQEAVDFLKEVWELNKNLELNVKYYEAMKEENDVRNEIKVVDQKLELMRKLNDDYKSLFGVDLVGKFRKINKSCKAFSNSISADIISENIDTINRKYSMFDKLDLLYTSDYLREAIQNTNYADLAIKYSKDATVQEVNRTKLPLNEVAASLSIQYKDRLQMEEQAILVIYNNHKYRKLCNAILQIDHFDTLPVKKVISKINGIKGFSKIKSECYDAVKKRIDDPINAKIKETLFKNYDFTSFETFVTSLIQSLVLLRNVNNKMVLNGDINMYLVVQKVEDISKEKFLMVTNDLNSLLVETKGTNKMIGITLLKENSPVLYSPYYFDVGDIYSKNASLQMEIKEMVDFELLVETSDILINIDPFRTNVVRYYTEPTAIDNVLVVDDLKMNYKTTFCKFAFTSNLTNVPVVESPVESVTSSDVSSPVVVSSPSVEESPSSENHMVSLPAVPSNEGKDAPSSPVDQVDVSTKVEEENVATSVVSQKIVPSSEKEKDNFVKPTSLSTAVSKKEDSKKEENPKVEEKSTVPFSPKVESSSNKEAVAATSIKETPVFTKEKEAMTKVDSAVKSVSTETVMNASEGVKVPVSTVKPVGAGTPAKQVPSASTTKLASTETSKQVHSSVTVSHANAESQKKVVPSVSPVTSVEKTTVASTGGKTNSPVANKEGVKVISTPVNPSVTKTNEKNVASVPTSSSKKEESKEE